MGRPWQALRALRLRLLGPEKELVGTDQFGNKYYRVPKHETRAGQTAQEETGSSCEHLMADELSYDSTEGVVIQMYPPASSSSRQLKVSPDGGSVVSETVHTVSSLNIPFGVSSQGVFRGLPSVVLKETTDDEADISVNLETFAFRDKRQIIPERRFVEAINRQAYQYEMGDFPTEWEAWIRKKRNDPPTIEEILKNENYREEMKQKIKDVSEKDKLLQAKEYKEGLVAEPVHTQVKGHASAPYYGKKEPSQDPTSIASTFQPGSWMPPGSGSGHNK